MIPPIPDAARALRRGELTAVELLGRHLEAVAAGNGRLDAVWAVDEGRARAAAEAADRDLAAGIDRGALLGIPFLVKDVIDLAGLATTCGSHVPAPAARADAEAVARLVAAGMVPLGKTATYEFALTGPAFDRPMPPARNPFDPSRIPGGSSSGSAAAVGGRLVRVALGTDTSGSLRDPASHCGVVALKPTDGAVPVGGVFPLSRTLDDVGPIAASTEEAALVFRALAGRAAPARPLQGEGMRIGYARGWFEEDEALHPAVLDALDAAAEGFRALGCPVEPVEMPDYALLEAVGTVIMYAEAFTVHRPLLRAHGDGYGRDVWRKLAAGAVLEEGDLDAALALRPRLRAQMDAAMEGFDALLTATVLAPPPRIEDCLAGSSTMAMRTIPFNVTGHPALALPCGLHEGMPLGMQLAARHGAEEVLFALGRLWEEAHPPPEPPSS
ncbi:amidase [Rubellimicrobium sp. CFH 75288]|uniref:amidase n=1 Tax=Rubellimicrobium sp. CFH 75288 TaxID=2697034 RepID=UPI00141233C7|nr:amidase [Rubellimicrobium sp. CFH 75288]